MDDMSGKGKNTTVEDLCNGAGFPEEILTRLEIRADYEKSTLEVWKDAASRRGNNYQFLIDAPLKLPCLRQWLISVKDFMEASRLEVPDHDEVWAQSYEGWPGTWKMAALHQFQAVAHATGVFHPPRPRVAPAKPTPVVKLPRRIRYIKKVRGYKMVRKGVAAAAPRGPNGEALPFVDLEEFTEKSTSVDISTSGSWTKSAENHGDEEGEDDQNDTAMFESNPANQAAKS
ncbi:hypothetical protein M758_4G068000 [Ceratodon purpureus]|nr:hypothetical protein M758_4G068000 [Ceratodon purpureus]